MGAKCVVNVFMNISSDMEGAIAIDIDPPQKEPGVPKAGFSAVATKEERAGELRHDSGKPTSAKSSQPAQTHGRQLASLAAGVSSCWPA